MTTLRRARLRDLPRLAWTVSLAFAIAPLRRHRLAVCVAALASPAMLIVLVLLQEWAWTYPRAAVAIVQPPGTPTVPMRRLAVVAATLLAVVAALSWAGLLWLTVGSAAALLVSVSAALLTVALPYHGKLPSRRETPASDSVRIVMAASALTGRQSLTHAVSHLLSCNYPGVPVRVIARDEHRQHSYRRLGLTVDTPGYGDMSGVIRPQLP